MTRPSLALLVAAALLVVALFIPWLEPDQLILFGALDQVDIDGLTGWERWHLLDAALLALAAALVLAAVRPLPRLLTAAIAAGCVLAAACIAVSGFDPRPATSTAGVARLTWAEGPVLALVALALALVGLAARARRTL